MPRSVPTPARHRPAVAAAVAASVVVHAGLVLALVTIRWEPARPARLTDAPAAETRLTLAPLTSIPEAAPEPEVPEPPPEPETAEPEVAAPEAERVAMLTPSPPVEIAPAPVAAPITAPRKARVETPARPPRPRAAPPVVASFAGVEATRARSVVYVVDASGAMTSTLDFVKAELASSLGRLDLSQRFQIIVFRDLPAPVPGRAGRRAGRADAVGPTQAFRADALSGATLLAPTDTVRADAAAWLTSIDPAGRSDPLAGLSAALALRPDLVFLLTRSIRRTGGAAEWGAGNAATLAALDRLNPADPDTGQRPTVIKAIQFLDEDPTGLLRAIASAHGDGPGSYTVVEATAE